MSVSNFHHYPNFLFLTFAAAKISRIFTKFLENKLYVIISNCDYFIWDFTFAQ